MDYNDEHFDVKSGRVILAIFMHNLARSDSELRNLRVHKAFNEINFIRDLENTRHLWLPVILTGDIAKLECLYDLLLSGRDFKGMDKYYRARLFKSFLASRHFLTLEKAKQVHQIIELLGDVHDQLENDDFDGREQEIDPFHTVCNIFEGKSKK